MDYLLDINGLSKHIGGPEGVEYNEVNPGLGMTVEDVNNRFVKALMAGAYKNSYNKPSVYAGGALGRRFGNDFYADLGGFGGVATGYGDVDVTYRDDQGNLRRIDPGYGDITPMAGVYANFGKKGLGRVGLKYMPGDPNLFMLNFSKQFR